MSWTSRILLGFLLLLIGAAAAVWVLSRYQPAARFVGVSGTQTEISKPPSNPPPQQEQLQQFAAPVVPQSNRAIATEIADLQTRVGRVENTTQQTQGSVGRADALLIAFAARRAIDRGVALGYLEPLLVDRFGGAHPQAVATVITASRTPVRLADLIADFQDLRPDLVQPAPTSGIWTSIKRQLGSLVTIHKADRPSTQPQARYRRALADLTAGEVDAALAETMRLPGAFRAGDWTGKARQYVAAHRALDEIESAALMGNRRAS